MNVIIEKSMKFWAKWYTTTSLLLANTRRNKATLKFNILSNPLKILSTFKRTTCGCVPWKMSQILRVGPLLNRKRVRRSWESQGAIKLDKLHRPPQREWCNTYRHIPCPSKVLFFAKFPGHWRYDLILYEFVKNQVKKFLSELWGWFYDLIWWFDIKFD